MSSIRTGRPWIRSSASRLPSSSTNTSTSRQARSNVSGTPAMRDSYAMRRSLSYRTTRAFENPVFSITWLSTVVRSLSSCKVEVIAMLILFNAANSRNCLVIVWICVEMARSRSFSDSVIRLKTWINCPTSSRVVGLTEAVRSPSAIRPAISASLFSDVMMRPASKTVAVIPARMISSVMRAAFRMNLSKADCIFALVIPICTTP